MNTLLSEMVFAPGMPPGTAMRSYSEATASPMSLSATMTTPRDILHVVDSSTDATVTATPARTCENVLEN